MWYGFLHYSLFARRQITRHILILTTKGKILSMMISLATFLANLVKISVAFTFAPQNFKLLTCEVTNPQIIVNPEKS